MNAIPMTGIRKSRSARKNFVITLSQSNTDRRIAVIAISCGKAPLLRFAAVKGTYRRYRPLALRRDVLW